MLIIMPFIFFVTHLLNLLNIRAFQVFRWNSVSVLYPFRGRLLEVFVLRRLRLLRHFLFVLRLILVIYVIVWVFVWICNLVHIKAIFFVVLLWLGSRCKWVLQWFWVIVTHLTCVFLLSIFIIGIVLSDGNYFVIFSCLVGEARDLAVDCLWDGWIDKIRLWIPLGFMVSLEVLFKFIGELFAICNFLQKLFFLKVASLCHIQSSCLLSILLLVYRFDLWPKTLNRF